MTLQLLCRTAGFACCPRHDGSFHRHPSRQPPTISIAGDPRRNYNQQEAIKEIDSCAGSQFDPGLAAQFINMIREDIEKTKFTVEK